MARPPRQLDAQEAELCKEYLIHGDPSRAALAGADDDLIGIAINGDEALGFLNIDGHGLGLHWRLARDHFGLAEVCLPQVQ